MNFSTLLQALNNNETKHDLTGTLHRKRIAQRDYRIGNTFPQRDRATIEDTKAQSLLNLPDQ